MIHRNLLKKFGSAGLKWEIDKLDVGKFETTPVDLSKLSDVVKNKVVEKTVSNELVKKFNAIQASNFSNLVKKTVYKTKIAEIEKKILDHDCIIGILLLKNLID